MSEQLKRLDLRSPLATRDMSADLGLVSECDGSTEVCQGKTRIIATVSGPSLAKYSRHEKHDRATLDIVVSVAAPARENSNATLFEKKCEKFLMDSLINCIPLTDFPRMVISIKVIVVEDDGGAMSVALNACSMALLDASMTMKYVPNSMCFAIVPDAIYGGSTLYLDPTAEEEARAASIFVFSMNPCDEQSVMLLASDCGSSNGSSFSGEELSHAMSCGHRASVALNAAMRRIISNKLMPSDD